VSLFIIAVTLIGALGVRAIALRLSVQNVRVRAGGPVQPTESASSTGGALGARM
jgi:hypothetical protein